MSAEFPLPKSPYGLRQPVIFQNPILNVLRDPGSPVPFGDLAFQLCREVLLIAVDRLSKPVSQT